LRSAKRVLTGHKEPLDAAMRGCLLRNPTACTSSLAKENSRLI
jgi:hypothetical protein